MSTTIEIVKTSRKHNLLFPKKMSNTGNIYEINSEQYDTEISLGKTYQYVVAAPAYYNIRTSRHKHADSALRRYKKLQDYSGVIIFDRDGQEVDPCSLSE
jgi:hypothetical protein